MKKKTEFPSLIALREFVCNDCGHEIDKADGNRIVNAIDIGMAYEATFKPEPICVEFTYDWKIVIKAFYFVNGKQVEVEFEP